MSDGGLRFVGDFSKKIREVGRSSNIIISISFGYHHCFEDEVGRWRTNKAATNGNLQARPEQLLR